MDRGKGKSDARTIRHNETQIDLVHRGRVNVDQLHGWTRKMKVSGPPSTVRIVSRLRETVNRNREKPDPWQFPSLAEERKTVHFFPLCALKKSKIAGMVVMPMTK